jgi:hypothetical protein
MSRPAALLLLLFSLAFLSGGAVETRADSLRFQLEYDYSLSDTESRTATGVETQTDASNFLQRYRLDFDRRIYPALTFKGGGLFERSDSEAETAGSTTESRLVRTSPYADLLLANPLYSAGVGFQRLEDRQRSSGTEEIALIRELYKGSFNWRPDDFPSLNLQYTLTETFDRDRVVQDDTSHRLQFGSRYQPAQPVQLSYQGNYTLTEGRLSQVETEQMTHSGRIDYSDRFWKGRTSFYSSYNISRQSTKTVATGQGEVETPLLLPPVTGLFALDDSPEDGELATSNVHVNDPANPIGITLIRGQAELAVLRNIGLEFPVATSMNTLRVWVVRSGGGDLLGAQDRQNLINAFAWRVFISGDGLTWTQHATATADFGPFLSRFELRFPTVSTRFIKVVVAPLAPTAPLAVRFPDLQASRLDATLFQPVADVVGTTSVTAHNLSLNARTRLLDLPSLYYDFSLFYTASEPSGVSRTFLTNGLSLQHRFKPTLSGSALVARDDSDEPRGATVGYRWGFTLLATPLPALSHTLSYSGRLEDGPEGSSNRNSLFLSNRAALYRGVDVLLNGGASVGENETGEELTNYQANLAAIVTPHRSMTWDFSLAADRSERTGGGRPDTTSTNRRGRVSLAWNPLDALSFFLALEAVRQEGEDIRTLRNYAVNWSPFRGGALQVNASYNETLRPEECSVDRSLSPSLLWEIRRGTVLTLSYARFESESPAQETTSQVISTNLRASF